MFCPNCRQKLEDDATFCSGCGSKTSEQNQQPVQLEPSKQSAKPIRKKKRSGCLTALLVLAVIAGVIAAAVYLFVPGLLRPYDLGVESSVQAYESAIQRMNYTKDEAPSTGAAEDYKYTYGSPQVVEAALSSEEITSFLSENRPDYYALKNVQVRINPDNTIEAAATLDVSYVFNSILNGKYSKEDARKALPTLGFLPDKVNIYCKLSGEIRDNAVEQMSIHKVSVLGITLPGSLIGSSDTQEFVEDTIGDYLEKTSAKSNTRYDLLKVEDEKLIFKGQIPSSITRTIVR